MGQEHASHRPGSGHAAPVRRRRVLAALGGAGVAGVAGVALAASPAGAVPTPWSPLNIQLKAVLQEAPYPLVAGATTTAETFVDTETGFVHLRFHCLFSSDPGDLDNGFWGFDIAGLGLPAPSMGSGGHHNALAGSVSAYPGGAAAYAPGGHELLIAGFMAEGERIIFAHGSTAPNVTAAYLNNKSPYDWNPGSTVKGIVSYSSA